MSSLKMWVVALFSANVVMLGLDASRVQPAPAVAPPVVEEVRRNLPEILLPADIEAGLEGEALIGSPQLCYTVGPFESVATADALIEMLIEYASEATARTTEAFVDRGYWVYVKPFKNELTARLAVNRLYKAGMEDVALVLGGDFHLAVSLGYFISQSNATRQRDRARTHGFRADMRIQRENEQRHWVDYVQQPGATFAAQALEDMVPAGLHQAISCPGFASETPADSQAG